VIRPLALALLLAAALPWADAAAQAAPQQRGRPQQAFPRLVAPVPGVVVKRFGQTDDLGIVALDQYDLPGAERCFRLVLGLSRKLGDVRYQAIAEQHLGLRFHLGDEPAIAERHYQEALRLHRAARDLRFEGWALGMSAYLSLESGRPEQAEAYASEALALYRSIGDPRTRAFLLVPQICALQARGRASDARLRLLEARQGLDPDEDRAILRALDCVDSERAGAIDASSGPVELQLTARVARTPRARAPTRMATDGSWFEAPGQPRVNLHRRRALRSLLAILVQHRQRAPGQGLLWEALLSAGWPGERVLASAGARRVYVAISSLRQMGLATTLLRMDDGYRLDESVILVPPSKV
jgi:tetratricopeptide (TPR) repeat protein